MKIDTPISPKVTAAGISGLIAALLLSVVTLITPDLFEGLGKWSGLAYGITITVVTLVAGYLKDDPLRVVPVAEAAAPTAEPASPASKFPAAAVAAATEPVTVEPVYETVPAAPATPVV